MDFNPKNSNIKSDVFMSVRAKGILA